MTHAKIAEVREALLKVEWSDRTVTWSGEPLCPYCVSSRIASRAGVEMPYVGKSMDRRRSERRRQLSGAHSVESWNATHPVGTAVRYWPIYPPVDGILPVDTTTRSEAWSLGDGSVVVLVVGVSGGVHLSHVEVRTEGHAK